MKSKSKKGACSAHVEAAKSNCLQHNRREGKVPSYVNPHLTHTNRVVFEDEMIRDRKYLEYLKRRAERIYTEKTGQKCQRNFTPFREDALRLKEGITDAQLMAFKEKAEQLTGWKVVGIWLHQDEGHPKSRYVEGDEGFAINYHAHVLYYCQDPDTGKSIRQHRKYFSLRQDLLADATGMERGNPAAETGITHRSALQQRIYAQEQRIEQLEAVADTTRSERDTAIAERDAARAERDILQAEVNEMKLTKAAKEKVMGVFGQSGKDKEIEQLKQQNHALFEAKEAQQRDFASKEADYTTRLEKARQGEKNANIKAYQFETENKDLRSRLAPFEAIKVAFRRVCDYAAKCARGNAHWGLVYENFEKLCKAKSINPEWKNGRHSVAADIWLNVVDPDNNGLRYGKFSDEQQQQLNDRLHDAADHPGVAQQQLRR